MLNGMEVHEPSERGTAAAHLCDCKLMVDSRLSMAVVDWQV
jgi:hypothetical protein